MKKCSLFLSVLLILVVLLSSCKTDNGNHPEQEPPAETNSSQLPGICLSRNMASEYIIFCDITNPVDRAYAQKLQSYFVTVHGAQIALRDASKAESTKNRILIGDVGLPEMDAIIGQTGSDDFAIRTNGTEIYLYGTSEEQYLLLDILLRNHYLKSEGDSLYMYDHVDFLSSRDQKDGQKYGTSASFAMDGSVSYTLIYSRNDDADGAATAAFAQQLHNLTGISVTAAPDTEGHEHEILFGNCNRGETKRMAGVAKSGDWLVGVYNGKAVLNGFDKIDRLYALYAFASLLNSNGGTVFESDIFLSSFGSDRHTLNAAEINAFYRSTYGTFATYVERRMAEMSDADKADQALVEQLIRRLTGGFAVCVGSSSALYDGNIVKLDSRDYSKKTFLSENGDVMVAAEFLNVFFDAVLPADANGFVNLSGYVAEHPAYSLYWKEAYQVAVVLPAGADSFEHDNTGVNGYRNREYLTRMNAFFRNPYRPEPENNTEQSRIVIEEAPFDPSNIYDYTVQGHLTYYSPGICVTAENNREVIYVSYESCMAIQMGTEYDNTTYLKRSVDGGKTWVQLGSVPGMRWGTLFEVNGIIYIIGTALNSGNAAIARYTPESGTFESKTLDIKLGNGAPCAVVIANGRIWRAADNVTSAPADADLFDPSSWSMTRSASDVLTMEDFIRMSGTAMGDSIRSYGNYGVGEGNIVLSPEGKIYAMFRVNTAPQCGYAVILEVSEDGRTLKQLPGNGSVVAFPSTQSKFTVRYDEKTKTYLSMVNLSPVSNTSFWSCRARNVMALVCSEDLVNWRVVDVLFVDRAMVTDAVSRASHAYQYADFDFSGDDLRIIVREATGDTYHYHDGKYITLYTLKNYADMIREG